MKKTVLGSILTAVSLFAHTPVMYCFDNGDDTITCEGGFSDGSSGAGVKFMVKQNGKIILADKFGDSSEITFKKPKGDFIVFFDAGKGHSVEITGDKIAE